ncbi:MAG: histidine phosphatase family protein [Betaproteobacteria bacterium]|nr:histidine phosphatase family protein [Betaproteobacteria bacterium]
MSSPAPTRITAVRHGETAWNAITRLQGQLDIDLHERGRWQAERVHAGVAPQAIVRDTGLRERSFGSLEGLTYVQVGELHPQEALRWKQRDPLWAPPQGESPTQVLVRVRAAVDAIAARHAGEHIAIVTHGGVLDVLYRLATGQELQAPRTWELGNCAINRLLWTPQGLSLVGWSDTGHLDEGPRDEFGS